MKKQTKKISRSLITFENGDDNEAVALAKMGLSNNAIKRATNNRLTDSQITYRLSKAKKVEENQFGYRTDYRNGTSHFALQMINDVAGVLREEVRRNITPKIARPTPETVKID